jgi:hypothetical protein
MKAMEGSAFVEEKDELPEEIADYWLAEISNFERQSTS